MSTGPLHRQVGLSLLTYADNFVLLYRCDNDYDYDYDGMILLRILFQKNECNMISSDFNGR